ncbi:MAG: DJ-1/PfpI family protein [Anaerolineae bacterium]
MAAKKVVIVLPVRGFSEEEYRAVRYALERRGHTVAIAGLFPDSAEAADGTSVPVDKRIRDIKTYEYDGYVFLGGEGVRIFFENEDARKLAKDISYKTIGASGEAVAFLALAGALKKKKVTGPTGWIDILKRNEAVYTGRPMEIDDKIITTQDASLGERFGNAIAEALAK